jgi:hypothetical protein
MIRVAGSLLHTRRLIPRSAFLYEAASSTSVSLRNVPRIALVCTRSFADEKPKRPDKDITNIYVQNQIWKQQKLDEDKDFFNKLGSGHAPDYMWIGKCSRLATGLWCML